MAQLTLDHLTALLTDTTAADHLADAGVVIDELDRWFVGDSAAVPLCNVCWAPEATTADACLAKAA
jgi:hypothetical protein